ncbi:glycosyltransferase family 2 protein [Glaciimonas sp. GG7]
MLTIIIPTYNHESYIDECLNAVYRIDVPGKKIIIIDDGSTDKTEDRIRKFIEDKGSDGIEFICKKNSGLVSSLNMGLEMTITEFLYIVASDDIPNPEGIVEILKELYENPSCQFYIGGGENFSKYRGSYTTPIYGSKQDFFFKMDAKKRNIEMFLNYPSPILLQSTIFRTAALRKIGGWDSNIILDDYPTFVKLLKIFSKEGSEFIYKPDLFVVNYRHHDNNTYKKLIKHFSMDKQAFEALAPSYLVDQAIGNALGYYILIGFRAKEFKNVWTIIKSTSWASRYYVFPSILNILMTKILSFLK